MLHKPLYLRTESASRDRWMISYLDILTILLIFFVAGASQSLRSQEPAPVKTPVKTQSEAPAITLPRAVLFPSGEDRIDDSTLPVVGQIAEVLRGIPNRVSLVGHADAVPIHNERFHNNWELSAARSLRLLELLSKQFGIPEARLSVSSSGSYQPKSPNDTENGRANNRCVEIVILAN